MQVCRVTHIITHYIWCGIWSGKFSKKSHVLVRESVRFTALGWVSNGVCKWEDAVPGRRAALSRVWYHPESNRYEESPALPVAPQVCILRSKSSQFSICLIICSMNPSIALSKDCCIIWAKLLCTIHNPSCSHTSWHNSFNCEKVSDLIYGLTTTERGIAANTASNCIAKSKIGFLKAVKEHTKGSKVMANIFTSKHTCFQLVFHPLLPPFLPGRLIPNRNI